MPVNMISCPASSQNAGLRPRVSQRRKPMAPFSGAHRGRGFDRSPLDYDENVAVGFTPVDDDLYREIILDHYRNPRHKHALPAADRSVAASNPLCGDEIDLMLELDGEGISAAGFEGRGCSISQASASMLCEAVTGLDVEAAASLARRFRAMLQGGGDGEDLGDLEALR